MTAAHDMRDLLRKTTQQQHMRLHAHPGLAALARGQLDRTGYSQLLRDLLPLHALVDRRLAPFSATPLLNWLASVGSVPSSDRLRADLACLDALPADMPDLGSLLAPFDTQAAALGCAWVVEGSSLGARVLSAALANSLGIGPGNGGAFFGAQPNQQARWPACCAAVEACGVSPDQRTIMVASARSTFDAFVLWLDRAS